MSCNPLIPGLVQTRLTSNRENETGGLMKLLHNCRISGKSSRRQDLRVNCRVISASRALALGQERVFERHYVVDERIFLRETLIAGRGDVKLDQLRDALASRLQSGDLIQTGRMIASREMLHGKVRRELGLLKGKGSFPRMGNFTPQDSLSPEQNRAADLYPRV